MAYMDISKTNAQTQKHSKNSNYIIHSEYKMENSEKHIIY